jgi:hypothetical protein
LLPKRPQTATQIAAAKARAEAKAAANKSSEGSAKEWLKALDVDELVFVLGEVFDAEYLSKLARALTPTPPTSTPTMQPSGSNASAGVGLRPA